MAQAAGRIKLLVIDDNPQLVRVVQRVMHGLADTTCTSSATEALSLVSGGERFDAILCDLRMPLMNGIEFYGRLLEVAPAQAERMMFMTGDLDRAAQIRREAPRSLGAIEKPFTPDELRRRLLRLRD